jgi:poly-beta-1,6-N-acetyl-D-glucosamine synthase
MFPYPYENPVALIALCLLLFGAGMDVLMRLIFLIRLPFHRESEVPSVALPALSVVIAARNEEENLRKLIPELMSQDYPQFELIVVNDSSWDETKDILDAFTHSYSNLHVIHLDEDKQRLTGKKVAVTLAMKAAKFDHVLLTDADCWPSSERWMRTMAGGFSDRKSIVLGYSPYKKKKGLLNFFIRYDAAQAALTYLNLALSGIPYMGVGRNLAYRKSLFFEKGGFRKHMHLLSGDDDLFVNENASGKNTTVRIHRDGHMASEPKLTWKEWFRQKKRHYTTAPHYKALHRLVLGTWPLMLILFYSGIVLSLSSGVGMDWIWASIGCRYIILLVTLAANAPKLGGAWFLLSAPLIEPIHLLLSGILYIKSGTGERNTWN